MLKNSVIPLLAFLVLALPAVAQQADLSIVGGGGFSVGENQDTHGISAVGLSFGYPYAGNHRIQLDYLFNNVHGTMEDRHFATASYVLQSARGRTRPFVQIGGGVVRRTFRGRPPRANDTGFAGVFGGGATISVWESLYIRPHIQVYAHGGPTLTVLPCVGVGYRF
ncbi:MAG TPA: hypothetical protein PLP04_17060 [Bryobacteraceae bacterium]|nr:hypothetical protein [Bryobacteraceae bacterium]